VALSYNYEKQYLDLCESLLDNGMPTLNKRTGKTCLVGETTIFTYEVGNQEFPIITTRQAFPKMSIAEPVGYWQGLTSAEDFRKLGTRSWDSNANKTIAWLDNPNRKGIDDMGKVYGYFGHNFGGVNQFKKVVDNLSKGIDDRGEIITYWKPDEFDEGCLRPCLHSLQYNLVGKTLNMTASQRSCDAPLGLVANMMQCYVMLALMARIVGHKAGKVTHVINNPHVYEDQIDLLGEQLTRDIVPCNPKLHICESIQSWEDIMALENMDKFTLTGYEHQGRIDFPFSE
jgi:thymidylate synthase